MIFHILALVCAVNAYDDQSLMQQGVGIETNVLESSVSAEWRSNLGIIQDAVKEIPFPGKMRQMAIDALMKSVSKRTSVDPSTKSLFADVQRLLWSIKDEFLKDRNRDQLHITPSTVASATCNTQGAGTVSTNLNAWEVATTGSRDVHKTCRTNSLDGTGASADRDTHCTALLNYLWTNVANRGEWSNSANGNADNPSLSPISCRDRGGTYMTGVSTLGVSDSTLMPDFHSYNSANVATYVAHIDQMFTAAFQHSLTESPTAQHVSGIAAEWGEYFKQNTIHWQNAENEFKSKKANCQDAAKEYNKVLGECNTNQDSFEKDYCKWYNSVIERCDTNWDCHAKETKKHDSLLADKGQIGDWRVRVILVIDRVLCLIKQLLEGNPSIVIAECDFSTNAAYQANVSDYYNITDAPVTPWVTCNYPLNLNAENYPPSDVDNFRKVHYTKHSGIVKDSYTWKNLAAGSSCKDSIVTGDNPSFR